MSLVSFAVRLHPASNASRQIAFHQIHKPTGQRVRQQLVVPEVGPVDRADIVKGYEVAKGRYVTLEPEEIDEVRLPTRHTIDLVQFVDLDSIDARYFDKPYYMVPDDPMSGEAFAVVREALRASRTAGLGEVVFAGREHLVAVKPCGRGLLLETLRYADEIRSSADIFAGIRDEPLDDDQLDLAKRLIQSKTAPFDPEKFSDGYEDALKTLIQAKMKNAKLPVEEAEPPTTNVIDLMSALKRSLSSKAPANDSTPAKKAPAKKPAAAAKKAAPVKKPAAKSAPARRRAS